MALRPYMQDGKQELGSWHPAMRPNTNDLEDDSEEPTVKTLSTSTIPGRAAENSVATIQLPFRPKSAQQDPPSTHPPRVEHSSSFPPTESPRSALKDDGYNSQGDTNDTKADIGEHFSTEEEGVRKRPSDAADIEATQAYSARPQTLAGEILVQGVEEPQEDRVAIDDDSHSTRQVPFPSPGIADNALGDQAQMDMAWELEGRGKAADNTSIFSRTNSFPIVPPVQHTKQMPPRSLPHSQVEDIMEENDGTASSGFEASNSGFPFVDEDQDPAQDEHEPAADEKGRFFTELSAIQKAVTTQETDEESRFEEGLPLMPASPHEVSSSPSAQVETEEAEGLRVLNKVVDSNDEPSTAPSEDISFFQPHRLDRKSTIQVLSSMHYAPHSVTHTEPNLAQDGSPPANETGNSIATSAHEPKSQALAEQGNNSETQSKDEYLTELWKAALGDDDLLEEAESSVDPSAFFEDDGEGFLEGDQDLVEEIRPQSAPSSNRNANYDQFGGVQELGSEKLSHNKYFPPSTSNPIPSQGSRQSAALSNQPAAIPTGSKNAMRQPSYSKNMPSRPAMPASTQSFADKSKGGYTSPYDLPMDVSRPKKRLAYQQIHPTSDSQPVLNRPPPPRSSSMFTDAPLPTDSQPPIPGLPSAYSNARLGNGKPPTLKSSPTTGGFFEELPSTKPRPPSSMGRFVPSRNQLDSTPPVTSQRDVLRESSLPPTANVDAVGNSQRYQLLPPEKMSLYGNTLQTEPSRQAVPAMNSRYSPAPAQSPNVPQPVNRYAASPSAGTRPPPAHASQYQPRTSSPLASNHNLPPQILQGPIPDQSPVRIPTNGRQSPHAQDLATLSFPFPHRSEPQNIDSHAFRSQDQAPSTTLQSARRSSPPRVGSRDAHLIHPSSDPSLASNPLRSDLLSNDESPSYPKSIELPPHALEILRRGPPQRSQTQSPGAVRYVPEPMGAKVPYQRPASVNQQKPLPSVENILPLGNRARSDGIGSSNTLNYIRPSDGREMDQLERWKGCPIFSFGFGGAIVTSFPKQIPRYAAGQAVPMMKCSPGEVKLQDGKIVPIEDDYVKFPGPLKSKSKKRDVMDWMQQRISSLENSIDISAKSLFLPDRRTCHEEKIMLWKIVRILVEHDGVLDNSPLAGEAIRSILSPEPIYGDTTSISHSISNAPLLGITRHTGSRAIPDPISSEAMEDLRKLLLRGEREKAVWHAVDNRLWAHAMLLSSTLDKDVWKQVSQEFVRQELKPYGENTEALAALYQIFAGNGDESADELVPPSARAGLHMISKTVSTGPTKNALDGLDRWRETLTLVLSNRSPDDGRALVALGQLLSGYGRIEAAHICYIFAKPPGYFGGPDDPQVSVALLGADHTQHPFDYSRDLDAILLTEVYDFARSVLAPSSIATSSPHLQAFKLYYAMILAEYGYKSEAQQYCEVITSTLNSTTKRSPYYHPQLYDALNGLMERLRQAPRDSSGSWISKPSIDKVSGSIWAKFNQYVAGDESDAASTGSGKGQDPTQGPFAGVSGGSPSLSRAPSSNDLYSSYAPVNNTSSSLPMPNPANSRYAPAGLQNPRPVLEQQGRSVTDYQRPTQTDSLRSALSQQQYQSRPSSSAGSYQEPHKPSYSQPAFPMRTNRYLPTPPTQPQHMQVAPHDELLSSVYQRVTDRTNIPLESPGTPGSLEPQPHLESISGYEPSSVPTQSASSYNEVPSINGYEPTFSSNYDPPSYNTELRPEGESSPEEKPKKKSYMEDDEEDDFEARAAALRREEKARKDHEANEAFRRAAEADSQKDAAPKLNSKKSGWFGGWLGGKKVEGEDIRGTPNAPIKAKLGEQSSFFYDSEQKRWVNKKDPDATPAAKAAPPPPKGPPSRAVSASGPPPVSDMTIPPVPPLPAATATPPISFTNPSISNLASSNNSSQHQSRSPSPAINSTDVAASVAGTPNLPSEMSSAPPSRPATGMSGANNIDDLLGAPQVRKGGTVRKGKKGRGYVDVMAK